MLKSEQTALSKIISVEVIGSLIATSLMVGGMWATITRAQEETARKVESQDQRMNQLDDSVQELSIDLATVRANQEMFKRQFVEQNQQLDYQRQDIKEILKILRERGQ